ncbi:MAG: ATP-binding cassette domain-containing protein [bacterium]|nr:ATP-binding cassette domain-containing protein [bacterium]
MGILDLERLTYSYPDAARPALEDVTVRFGEGELALVTGPSGSGKTTLARAAARLVPDFFGGRFGGDVRYRGRPLRELDAGALHAEIGFVFQEPERQLLMATAEREIAFGPENLGLPPAAVARRVVEAAESLGVTGLLGARTDELSGGMQQRIVLAAAVAMQPAVLILDEPTSRLDPVAARDLLGLLARLRDDLGCTIVLVEERLADCLRVADRVLHLDGGAIAFDGAPAAFSRWAAEAAPLFLPPVARLFPPGLEGPPLTVREARARLAPLLPLGPPPAPPPRPSGGPLVVIEGARFAYPGGAVALRGIGLVAAAGEVVALIGPNGAGKTTLLKAAAGLIPLPAGSVAVAGGAPSPHACGFLPQNADTLLLHDTVLEEVAFTLRASGLGREGAEEVMRRWGVAHLAGRNPRELGAGERQCVSLAAAAAAAPPVLLLDEPVRGLDPLLRERAGGAIAAHAAAGGCVVLATQDIEFAAERADRVVLLAGGEVVEEGRPRDLFHGEPFYSPQVSRLFRGAAAGVVTVGDARRLLAGRGGAG